VDHLRYFRYFIAVAEERSFTAAAERLNTVQPSLSQQIKRLEDICIGTPLFQRDKHHVELTEAGRVFLPEARAILDHVDRAVVLARQAARAEIGQLRIGFVPGAEGKVFAHVLPVLRDRYPGIHLILRSLTTPEQIQALQDRSIDVAFLRAPVEDRTLECITVLREDIVAAVPARQEIARHERISVLDLAEIPFVQVARLNAPAVHDAARQIAAQAGVQFDPVLETDSVLGTLNAVGSGLGFSLLPDYVRQIAPDTVAVRPLACDPHPRIELMAAYHKDDRTPALEVFLGLLRAWIAENEAC
jgi:LysR family transcriptional regulator, hca operon transcriptional activator